MPSKQFDLTVNDHKLISAVQEEFNSFFPYLKIEFFRKPHEKGEGSARKNMYDADTPVNKIISRKGTDTAPVPVNGSMKVHEFEKSLKTQFGLHVQVFRKSGNVWLETSATDGWTLDEQNAEGKSLQQQLRIEREDPDDHDMYG